MKDVEDASTALDAGLSRPGLTEVAIITVNWNGWQHTLELLSSLRKNIGAPWHLFIVDNASSDESVDRLRDLGDDVTFIQSQINTGWSGGNNIGLRAAVERGFETYLLLNNDVVARFDMLEVLQKAKGEGRGGPIFGPLAIDSQTDDIDFAGADRDAKTGFPIWRDGDSSFLRSLPEFIDTCFIKGVGILFDSIHLAAIGFFDDRFFLNFDETDWCFRAAALGFRLVLVRDAKILHFGSASIGGRTSPLQIYFLARNGLLFGEKHCNPMQRIHYLRRMYWDARNIGREIWPAGWALEFLRARDGVGAAFKRGVGDYVLRRFGDCPPIVRDWNRRR